MGQRNKEEQSRFPPHSRNQNLYLVLRERFEHSCTSCGCSFCGKFPFKSVHPSMPSAIPPLRMPPGIPALRVALHSPSVWKQLRTLPIWNEIPHSLSYLSVRWAGSCCYCGIMQAKRAATVFHRKRGRLSKVEEQFVLEARARGLTCEYIAGRLGRSSQTIWRHFAKLQASRSSSETSQALPIHGVEMYETVFENRLEETWWGVYKSDMGSAWRKALQRKSREQWLLAIIDGTPPKVKTVLGASKAPTFDSLVTLDRVEPDMLGVYAQLAACRDGLPIALERFVKVQHSFGPKAGFSAATNHPATHSLSRQSGRSRVDRNLVDVKYISLMRMQAYMACDPHLPETKTHLALATIMFSVLLGTMRGPPESPH